LITPNEQAVVSQGTKIVLTQPACLQVRDGQFSYSTQSKRSGVHGHAIRSLSLSVSRPVRIAQTINRPKADAAQSVVLLGKINVHVCLACVSSDRAPPIDRLLPAVQHMLSGWYDTKNVVEAD